MTRASLIGSVAAALLLTATSSAFAGDVYRDLNDIRRDKVDIYRDSVKLRQEQAERNYDAQRELRAIRNGNYWAAEKWDARRRHEQGEINAINRDLRKDRVDLAKDRYDLRRDTWRY
jgi:hypothetical protein